MRYGIREVCDMAFTKLSGIGPEKFIIESAKTSTLESASTTVYAQGGQGNSRLMAWEGEKTLTFTVEDALISMESFWALTGARVDKNNDGLTFKTFPTTFAGFYTIKATTFFRDELGVDHPATIVIPRAKLQSNINIAMAPSGDPSSFTFTFDAFPNQESAYDKDLLFSLTINDKEEQKVEIGDGDNILANNEIVVKIEGMDNKTITSDTDVTLQFTASGVTLNNEALALPSELWKAGAIFTDLVKYVAYDNLENLETPVIFTLKPGTTTKFYII